MYPLDAHAVGHAGEDTPTYSKVADPDCPGAGLEAKDSVAGGSPGSSL